MGRREEWSEICDLLRAASAPERSPHLASLYALAAEDGRRSLATFRDLDEERRTDFIHELLASRLGALIASDSPRAYFMVALRHLAISWQRRGDARIATEGDADDEEANTPALAAAEEERHAFLLDANAALRDLSSRDRSIVVAAALGEDREEIARGFGTSRANVDKIVNRLQLRFREEGP